MRWRMIAMVATGLALTMTSVRAQRAGRPTTARVDPSAGPCRKQIQASAAPAQFATAQSSPSPWVSVEWGLTLDVNTRALYQHMADVLSAVTAVPNSRLNYYSAVVNDIAGWSGMVTNVQAVAGGGYSVTISVEANPAAGSQYGDAAKFYSDYSETYHIDVNNNVTFAGSDDPEGLSGLVPAVVSN